RTTQRHALDVKGVIAYLRGDAPLPVFLIGTSMGTVSAANAAARLQQGGADGVVLTSTVTRGSLNYPSVYDTDLGAIRIPVLLLHHAQDYCAASPPGGAEALAGRLRRTTQVELRLLSGGLPRESDYCEPRSAHGFFGSEDQATAAISAWINAHLAHG
ncbi:MAG TPA: alpha/beta hydrolase, partial [bacterium]|nr:alpha/beta hydrolase [bacterium]